jgi:hypothetical protein
MYSGTAVEMATVTEGSSGGGGSPQKPAPWGPRRPTHPPTQTCIPHTLSGSLRSAAVHRQPHLRCRRSKWKWRGNLWWSCTA